MPDDVFHEHKFHVFERGEPNWTNVYPGDCVICPGVIAFFAAEFDYRNELDQVKPLQLAYRPVIILARHNLTNEEGKDYMRAQINGFKGSKSELLIEIAGLFGVRVML